MRLVLIGAVLSVSCVILSCGKDEAPPRTELTTAAKAELLQRLRNQSGLSFDRSTELRYFHENERAPGVEEWILFSTNNIDFKSLPLDEKPLQMNDFNAPQNVAGIIEHATHEKVNGKIIDLYAYYWSTAKREYHASALRTEKGTYVSLEVFPRKGRGT